MKKINLFFLKYAIILAAILFSNPLFAQQDSSKGYYIQSEKQIETLEPGSHKGGGTTTAYKFFKSIPVSKLQLTKRILHPGSAIGYHLQKEEEIYYILSGTGEMTMNGKTFPVKEGDAILTLPGNSHGLKQTGETALVVIINYEKNK